MRIVGLEEHFVTADVLDAWRKLDLQWQDLSLRDAEGETVRRLIELDGRRLGEMDETGLDVQVLSLTTAALHNLEPAAAAAMHTPEPAAAAHELERAVTRLGLDGGMLFGRTRERNLDNAHFWPIFEVAAGLRAPLYLHPQSPVPAVRAAYYSGFGDETDRAFATAGIG